MKKTARKLLGNRRFKRYCRLGMLSIGDYDERYYYDDLEELIDHIKQRIAFRHHKMYKDFSEYERIRNMSISDLEIFVMNQKLKGK